MNNKSLEYQTGFRNNFESEAIKGALPKGQNSPQKCPFGLYAEQLTGSAFTAPRSANLRSWLYRIRPSVVQSEFTLVGQDYFGLNGGSGVPPTPNQLRWGPMPVPEETTDFIAGLSAIARNGGASQQAGCTLYRYAFNTDMSGKYFYSADGEMVLVPQAGGLHLVTEMGVITANPGEIVVVPRGVKFKVSLGDGAGFAAGYICENHGAPFELPSLGPIGANGLANPRDFKTPEAAYEDIEGDFALYAKYGENLWRAQIGHSPCDVVAWHGNYAPYKYDLDCFNTINTVSFDHPDPSIFTVLTSPSDTPGTANVDFVIFPPRWMVAEKTFRPPYFHRNFMSEFMGLIRGEYDAKADGFVPGGASLHNCMTPHGPDAATFEKASNVDLKPERMANTMAFMFESRFAFEPTRQALESRELDHDYVSVWQGLTKEFSNPDKG